MKIFQLNKPELSAELSRHLSVEESKDTEAEKTVLDIMNNIRKKGFRALAEYSKKYDKFELTENNFQVKNKEIDALARKISPDLSKSLSIAIERIKEFHKKELLQSFKMKDKLGNIMGQKVLPLESVAVYIPGGAALYPSTLYMTVIPALIAGVKRIVLLSPPRTFEQSSEVAWLVKTLGITEVYRIGGAQAVIAAAFGAGRLKPVDKIVGPGNIYVATAKRLVYGKVDIDMIAGPSEILVIADTRKDEDVPLIASDLLSQAEHGPAGWARSILVAFDKDYALKIKKETYDQANLLPIARRELAIKSLDQSGIIVICKNKLIGIEISNLLAPEHLELYSNNPYTLLNKVKNAGSVFLGKYTPESVGDYIGGPNHVLPTSQTARFYSPLGVYNFQKRFSFIEFNKMSLKKYVNNISLIARSEGLEAHARSAEKRFK